MAGKTLDDLRNSLEDVLSVLTGLQGSCQTLDEVAGVVQLALTNDGQLRLLMEQVKRAAQSKEGKR